MERPTKLRIGRPKNNENEGAADDSERVVRAVLLPVAYRMAITIRIRIGVVNTSTHRFLR